MLRQHNQSMLALLMLADGCAVALAWLGSYWLRFALLPVDAVKGVPDLADKFLPLLPVVVAAHLLVFYRIGLYRPRRDDAWFRETRDIFKAFVVAVVCVVLIDYLLPQTNKISRQFVLTYAVVGSVCFAAFRGVLRILLRYLRRRGWNQRHAAIVGSGRNAQRLVHALRRNAWTGLHPAYFIDDLIPGRPTAIRDVAVYGPIADISAILDQHPVDCVFIALPTDAAHRTDEVLAALQTSMADVRLVPEITPEYAMRPNVSSLDGVAILSLRQTPMRGSAVFLKRGFDLVVGGVCLLIAAIPMAVIAGLIKVSSPGPVFYRQRRVGFDGRQFEMMKFRTMRVDAERGGPVWSQKTDSRRTRVGTFLRRTSLDELPNLFNVIAGHMSLVGPRPERPEFIQKFKHEIPQYMLRHKMKAGMTGYAQIKGHRGDTDLRKRIQHDLHYIRHWSLLLDVRILAATVTGVWFSKHEA